MTNFERIKAMPIDDMAKFLVKAGGGHYCTVAESDCIYGWHTSNCEEHAKMWLEQEAKQGE